MANVEMIVWDVQHGNAIYLKTPNNRHMVFDLGIGDYSGHNETFSPLATLWHQYHIRKLDYVMVTHPHLDHIDDILNFEAFHPSVFHRPTHLSKEAIMKDIRNSDKQKFEKYFELNDRYIQNIAGTSDDLDIPANYGGISFQHFITPTLPTDNLNNHSFITVLEYSNIKVVIPGDNEYASLEILMRNEQFRLAIKDCDILIAPHHGRESAYHFDFVTHANPRVTLIDYSVYDDPPFRAC